MELECQLKHVEDAAVQHGMSCNVDGIEQLETNASIYVQTEVLMHTNIHKCILSNTCEH